MTTLIGQEFGGYRIISQVGKGGMATVYKAFQASLDRYVAIKVMPPFYAEEDDTFLKRFKREARSVAKLRHPNILMVIDFGEREGLTYIVMEYVDAGTLTDRLGVPMPLNDIASIIDQVAGALDYAHGQGVIHRDVKPSNILLPKPNWPLLTDFGLAKIVGGSQLTITGSIAGTPAYMSPEQGQGEAVDSRSDIYSLGIVLYEMATGVVPYHAETPMAVVVKHIIDPLPLPRSKNPDLPEEIERVILKALSKKPEDRYQRVKDMSNALMEACERIGAPTILKETVVEEVDEVPPAVEEPPQEEKVQVATEIDTGGPPVSPDLDEGEEQAESVPSPTPPPPEGVVPSPSPSLGLFKRNPWLKWAIPVGAVIGFFCMVVSAAILIPTIIGDGLDPTPTTVVDAFTVDEHTERGYEFYDSGEYEAAVEEFEAAINQGSEDADMYFTLADAYYALGREDETIGTIERAISIAPNTAWVHESAGWFYQDLGLHQEAIRQFEKALELDPSADWVLDGMAISYEALGEADKANEIRGSTTFEEKEEDPYQLENQGWELLEAGQYHQAEQAFSKAIELDPNLLSAWGGLADSYWYRGDNESAISTLQAAIEINPPEGWVYEQIGYLYWESGEIGAAIEAYEISIELDPAWSYGYNDLANIYLDMGDSEKAIAILEQGAENNPERDDIYESMGWLYFDLGEYQKSVEAFQRATEINPSYGWNYYGLAVAYEYAGRPGDAGEALEAASSNSFDDPWLEDAIGWEYIELGRCDLAIQHFEKALEIDPNMTESQDGIEFCSG